MAKSPTYMRFLAKKREKKRIFLAKCVDNSKLSCYNNV